MNTTPQHQVSAPARPSNAYVPPAAARRRPDTAAAPAVEVPADTLAEAIPIFKVGYRKVRSTVIVFPDRRVRCVTPKLAALETVAEHQELLLSFADSAEARRQPLKMLQQATGVMREIMPFMIPDDGDREFLIEKFDDERVEETELITQLLKAFTYLMGTLTGAQAANPPAAREVEAPEPEDVPEAPTEAEEFTAEDPGGRFGITATQHDPALAYHHRESEGGDAAAEDVEAA
jgi:hypothetical protein